MLSLFMKQPFRQHSLRVPDSPGWWFFQPRAELFVVLRGDNGELFLQCPLDRSMTPLAAFPEALEQYAWRPCVATLDFSYEEAESMIPDDGP